MSRKLNFKTDVIPFLIATIGEFVALHYWLLYMDIGYFILANVLLWAGFIVERGSVAMWIRKVYRPKEGITSEDVPFGKQLIGWFGITFSEILIWIIWFYAVEYTGNIVACIILYPLMLIEHSVELGLVKRKNLLLHTIDLKTHFFTLMEVLAAALWIYFYQKGQIELAALALFTGLAIEHIIEGSALVPDKATESEKKLSSHKALDAETITNS
jgi:hypothetical protein